jgi:penicillin-insensitive murein endopeptidase
MSSGHASHQIGIDVDFWLNPMPARPYTARERETVSAVSMLASGGQRVNPNIWTGAHARLLKRAASYPEVARIFIHPAIKKALCEGAGADRAWLHKLSPWWGHHYHFHVRLKCPKDSPQCKNQKPVGAGDRCGAELNKWLARIRPPRKEPSAPPKPRKAKPQITLADLPAECTTMLRRAGVLEGGARTVGAAPASNAAKRN